MENCLVDSFRAMGLKVPYIGDGPYYAVRDGMAMLLPLGYLDCCISIKFFRSTCI